MSRNKSVRKIQYTTQSDYDYVSEYGRGRGLVDLDEANVLDPSVYPNPCRALTHGFYHCAGPSPGPVLAPVGPYLDVDLYHPLFFPFAAATETISWTRYVTQAANEVMTCQILRVRVAYTFYPGGKACCDFRDFHRRTLHAPSPRYRAARVVRWAAKARQCPDSCYGSPARQASSPSRAVMPRQIVRRACARSLVVSPR